MSQLGLFVWNKPACSRVHLYMFPSLKDIKGCTRIQNKLCSVTWICKRLTFTSFDGTELFMPYFQALPSLWKTVVSHLKWCLLLGDCCNKFLLSTSYWICFQLYILNYVLVKITTCAQLPNYKNYFSPRHLESFQRFCSLWIQSCTASKTGTRDQHSLQHHHLKEAILKILTNLLSDLKHT